MTSHDERLDSYNKNSWTQGEGARDRDLQAQLDEALTKIRVGQAQLEAAQERFEDMSGDAMQYRERAKAAEQRCAQIEAWANDLLVYLDVEVESLPENEYKIYEEGYDKTIAGLQAALRRA